MPPTLFGTPTHARAPGTAEGVELSSAMSSADLARGAGGGGGGGSGGGSGGSGGGGRGGGGSGATACARRACGGGGGGGGAVRPLSWAAEESGGREYLFVTSAALNTCGSYDLHTAYSHVQQSFMEFHQRRQTLSSSAFVQVLTLTSMMRTSSTGKSMKQVGMSCVFALRGTVI